MKKGEKEKGITLIVLVVTIVVILILAGITVNLAFDENGIIKRAQGLQETINQSVEHEEQQLEKLTNQIAETLNRAGIGEIPDNNDIGGGGEETNPPLAPKVEVLGTQGENGYYRSEVEISVMANDKANTMTYTIEGTGISQGSVDTETSIGNGQSIKVKKDGTYTITVYEYNRNGQKSDGTTVTVVKDTVAPTGSLVVTNVDTMSITVQLVADDSEPSAGLATDMPYTFYYKEIGADTWIEAGKGATSTYTFAGLKSNTSYSLKAEVTDKAGNTGTSNELTNVQVGIIDDTKPGILPITPREPEIIKSGETSTEIILTPTEQPVTIDPDKFIPIDENGTPITDPNTKVTVTQDEEGKIHITITGGDTEGEVNVKIEEGGITDPAGNENDKITIDTNITVDNTKPTMEITGPVEGTIIKKDESIEITIIPSEEVTINKDKIILTGDGSTGTTTSVTQDPDGTIHIVVTGGEGTGDIAIQIEEGFLTDKAGNPSAPQTLPTYQIDNAPPTVQAVVTGTTTDSITVQATATDNGPAGLATENTYTYHITGNGIDKTITKAEASYTFTDLPQKQEYTITVTVTDAKGNTNSATVTVTTGTVPAGTGNIAFSEVTWKCDEATSYEEIASITITKTNTQTEYKMQYQKVEEGNQTTEDGWIEVTGDSITLEGLHHKEIVYARLVDRAGNAGNVASASILDSNVPIITAVGAPSNTYIKNGQTVSYSITTNEIVTLADSTKATVTGTGNTGCSVTITGSGTSWTAIVTGGTGNGAVTLNLAIGLFQDTAENATATTTTKTGLTIDNTPPTMTVSPASGLVAKTRNVTVTISDSSSGLSSSNNLTYYVSTSNTNPTASGYKTGTYKSGTAFTLGTSLTGTYYLFLPVVADNVGNTSTATITGYYRCGSYLFDNTAPTVSNVVLDAPTTTGFKVTITASDTGSAGIATSSAYTIYYKESSATSYSSVTSTSNTYTFTNLTDGTTYSVYVTAKDALGNISGNSATKTIQTLYIWNVYTVATKAVWNNVVVDSSVLGTKTSFWESTQTDSYLGQTRRVDYYTGSINATSIDELTYVRESTDSNPAAPSGWYHETGTWGGESLNNWYYSNSRISSYSSGNRYLVIARKLVNTGTTEEVAGSFVKTVTSSSATAYPTNGKHTDGYWYIRQ